MGFLKKGVMILGLLGLCVGMTGCNMDRTKTYSYTGSSSIVGELISSEKDMVDMTYTENYSISYNADKVTKIEDEVIYVFEKDDINEENAKKFVSIVETNFNNEYKDDGLKFKSSIEKEGTYIAMTITADLAKINLKKTDLSTMGIESSNVQDDGSYLLSDLETYIISAGLTEVKK